MTTVSSFVSTHPLSRGIGLNVCAQVSRIPVSGCIYDSLTFLFFSYIDSFHPFSCCLPTISPLTDPTSLLASATQHHEQDQARLIDCLAKSHNFTPCPELPPFSDSPRYLYYLFPPLPTADLITQVHVHPSSVSVISVSGIIALQITAPRGRRAAASDQGGGEKVGEVKGLMYENDPPINVSHRHPALAIQAIRA